LSEAMQGADIIRLYGLEVTGERHLPRDAAQYLTQSGGAYDLEFSSSPRLFEFLADRGLRPVDHDGINAQQCDHISRGRIGRIRLAILDHHCN